MKFGLEVKICALYFPFSYGTVTPKKFDDSRLTAGKKKNEMAYSPKEASVS